MAELDERRLLEVKAEALAAACMALHAAAKECASRDVSFQLRLMADSLCEESARVRDAITKRWP